MRILNLSVQGSSALFSLLLLALAGPVGISSTVSAAEAGDPTRGESGGAKFGEHRRIVFAKALRPPNCRSDRWG